MEFFGKSTLGARPTRRETLLSRSKLKRRPQIEVGVEEEPNGRSRRFKITFNSSNRKIARQNDVRVSFPIN
jgi:hypothetical protein